MAEKIYVCGFGDPEGGISVFIDRESGVEVEASEDGFSIRCADREVFDQLFCVLGGVLGEGG